MNISAKMSQEPASDMPSSSCAKLPRILREKIQPHDSALVLEVGIQQSFTPIGSQASFLLFRHDRPNDQLAFSGNLSSLPFENETLDVIMVFLDAAHYHHFTDILAELYRVLRVNGFLYIEVHNSKFALALAPRFTKQFLTSIGFMSPNSVYINPVTPSFLKSKEALAMTGFQVFEESESIFANQTASLLDKAKDVIILWTNALAPLSRKNIVGFYCKKGSNSNICHTQRNQSCRKAEIREAAFNNLPCRVLRIFGEILAALFMKTKVTPNIISVATLLVIVSASVIAAQGGNHNFLTASLLLLFAAVLDCTDGSLARRKKLSSDFGGYLDELCDDLGNISITVGLFSGLVNSGFGVVPAVLPFFTYFADTVISQTMRRYRILFIESNRDSNVETLFSSSLLLQIGRNLLPPFYLRQFLFPIFAALGFASYFIFADSIYSLLLALAFSIKVALDIRRFRK